MLKITEKLKYLAIHVLLKKQEINVLLIKIDYHIYSKFIKTTCLMAMIGIMYIYSAKINAEIIDNGKYTTDTLTNLDWLDVSETVGLSYNQVLSQIDKGGNLEGWTFATRQQINVFISNVGFVIDLKAKKNINSVSKLLDLLGRTNFREKLERGDECKFMYGSVFTVQLFNKKIDRVYIGSIAKVGGVDNERGVVLLNNIQASLGAGEKSNKIGSALVRSRISKYKNFYE